MPDFKAILLVHTLCGIPALITFWIAALARKGSRLHRRAGRIYLASMIGILLTTLPIILIRAREGRVVNVIFLGYLCLVVATGVSLAWRSIREKRSLSRFAGRSLRILAAVFFLYGLVILALSLAAGSAARTVFMAGASLIGIVSGFDMWRLLRSPDERWWLAQHMNGAALNFAATHASFLGLGLKSAIPALGGPWMHTTTQLAVIALALVLRLALGRRYLGGGGVASGSAAASGAASMGGGVESCSSGAVSASTGEASGAASATGV